MGVGLDACLRGQLRPSARSLAVVDLMVAAVRWPGVLLIAACVAAVSSAVRACAVALLLSRCALHLHAAHHICPELSIEADKIGC